MQVANLQLEGLLMAVASINNALVSKGILSVAEIDTALQAAEASFTDDPRVFEGLTPSNWDAMCFPIRFLRLANLGQSEDSVQSFFELARTVGETKS